MKPKLPPELAGGCIESSNGAVGIISLERAMASPGERDARLVFGLVLIIVSSNFSGGDVEEFSDRTIGRAGPVGRSMQAGIYQSAFQPRLHFRHRDPTPMAIQPPRPV